MRKIEAEDTELGVINHMALASETRAQMRSFTVNDKKKEDSDQNPQEYRYLKNRAR